MDIEACIRRNIAAGGEARAFGAVRWLAGAEAGDGAEMAVAHAVFEPGKGNEEHTHPDAEELVFVIEGEIEHTLADASVRLRAGDVFIVPRGAPHRLWGAGETPARALIVFSTADRQFVPTGRGGG